MRKHTPLFYTSNLTNFKESQAVSLQSLLHGIEGDSRYVPEDIENAIDDGHITWMDLESDKPLRIPNSTEMIIAFEKQKGIFSLHDKL